MCTAFRDTDEWERLRATAIDARALAESVGYRPGIASSLAHSAYVPYVHSDFQAAIPMAVRSLQVAEECGSALAESQACAVLALVYWSLGDFDSAVRFVERARLITGAISDRPMMAFAYILRGSISQSLGDLEGALNWAAKGHAICVEDGFQLGQARALIVQGGVFRAMGRRPEALDALTSALDLAEECGNQLGVSRALNDLGAVYRDFDRPAETLDYYRRALEIRQRNGYRSAEITTLLDLAELHSHVGNREAAIRDASAAATLAVELGVKPKSSQAHRLLADLYEAAGDFRQAVVHWKEHQSLYSAIAHDQAAARLKTSELIASLERLRAEQASFVESEKRAALANLAGTLAHEINSPLGALYSSCDSTVRCVDRLVQVWDANGKNPRVNDLLEILKKSAGVLTGATRRVQSVFERFRNFAQWDDQDRGEVDLIEALERAFTVLALRPEVAVRRDLDPLPKISGHAAEINQVFLQLLSNAEASISGPGEIRITSRADGNHLSVEVADTGAGINPERLPKLFEPGFVLGDSRIKASFSLFACQHIIRKHGGEIRAASTPGRGSVFTVVLPREVSALLSLNRTAGAPSSA